MRKLRAALQRRDTQAGYDIVAAAISQYLRLWCPEPVHDKGILLPDA